MRLQAQLRILVRSSLPETDAGDRGASLSNGSCGCALVTQDARHLGEGVVVSLMSKGTEGYSARDICDTCNGLSIGYTASSWPETGVVE